jgi:nucleoside-diphosphate-sugar epimerase
MPPHPQTIALTGATGFLGGHVARAALASGANLRAVVRDEARAAELVAAGAEARRASLHEGDALAEAFRGADVVVANAALGSWSGTDAEYVATNVNGPVATIAAAARAGVSRVVLVSTVAVWRATPFATIDESTPLRDEATGFDWSRFGTDARYARTKTAGERAAARAAEAHGVELVVLRPGPIYGSGDTRFTRRLLRTARRTVRLAPTARVPLVHAGDVAHAVLAAITHRAREPLILAGDPVALATVVERAAALLGTGGVTVPLPVPLGVRFSWQRAAESLGFRNRPLDEGLRECIEGER